MLRVHTHDLQTAREEVPTALAPGLWSFITTATGHPGALEFSAMHCGGSCAAFILCIRGRAPGYRPEHTGPGNKDVIRVGMVEEAGDLDSVEDLGGL